MKLTLPKRSYLLPAVATLGLVAYAVGSTVLTPPAAQADAINATDFVMTVDTSGSAAAPRTFTIPTIGAGHNYNYTVDCNNDGVIEASGLTGNYTCTYNTPGIYTIRIGGSFSRMYFNNSGDRLKVRSIDQWGTGQWTSMERAFYGATHMDVKATDTPDLTRANNLAYMFAGVTALKGESANWRWDTSGITNMNATFLSTTSFNQPLPWNTGKVTNFNSTFSGATAFNQPLNDWDVSQAEDASFMFVNATSFNQPLDRWNTSKLRQIRSTFLNAASFDQSLANWNMTEVTAASEAFSRSGMSLTAYDQTLIGWDKQALRTAVTLGAAGRTYCRAEAARAHLTEIAGNGGHGWTITGDSKNCPAFQVSFDSKSGSAVAAQTVTYGQPIVEPTTPTRQGYTFGGWYTDDAVTMPWDFAAATMPAQDLTLYAKWLAITPPANPGAPANPANPANPNSPASPAGPAATDGMKDAAAAVPTQSTATDQRLSDTGQATWLVSALGAVCVAVGGGVVYKLRRSSGSRAL